MMGLAAWGQEGDTAREKMGVGKAGMWCQEDWVALGKENPSHHKLCDGFLCNEPVGLSLVPSEQMSA